MNRKGRSPGHLARLPMLVILLGLALQVSHAQRFQGVITFESSGAMAAGTYKYFIKGSKIRMEFSGTEQESSPPVLMDASTRMVRMLIPDARMFLEVDLRKDPDLPGESRLKAVLRRTGATEEIAGYPCEQVFANVGDFFMELWLARDIGPFMEFNLSPDGRNERAVLEQELTLQKLFPLRYISRNRNGQEQTRIEARKVEPRRLEDYLFDLPVGYRKMEMPDTP